MKSIAKELGTSPSNMQEMAAASIPPGTIKQPEILLDLNKLPKQTKKKTYTHIPGQVSGHVGKLP